MDLPHLCGTLHRGHVQPPVPGQSGQGPDRALHRLRPADPDRLRPRPRPGPGGGRQGRRAGQPSGRHAGPVRPDPPGAHEHLHDHQRHGALAAGPLCGPGGGAGGGPQGPAGHHPERPDQGIPVAGDLHLSAAAEPAADLGHDRLVLWRDAEVQPDECLLLPPAGGGGDAGAGAGLCARHRHRRAGRRPRRRAGACGGVRQDRLAHLLLRQCGHPVRHRNVQDARLYRALGRNPRATLWRDGGHPAAIPLRGSGELAGPDGAAAGEQRLSYPDRDAGRDPVQVGAGARRAAAGLERGAGSAATLGPAVVPAHAADTGPGDRPAGIRGPVRWLAGGDGQGGGAEGRRPGGTGHPRRHGRGGRGRGVRLHEGPAGGEQYRPPAGHRERGHDGGGRQSLHHDGGLAPDRRGRGHPAGGPGRGGRRHRAAAGLAGGARSRRRGRGLGCPARGRVRCRQHHAALHPLCPGRRHHRRMGGDPAPGVRRVPRPDRRGRGRALPRGG